MRASQFGYLRYNSLLYSRVHSPQLASAVPIDCVCLSEKKHRHFYWFQFVVWESNIHKVSSYKPQLFLCYDRRNPISILPIQIAWYTSNSIIIFIAQFNYANRLELRDIYCKSREILRFLTKIELFLKLEKSPTNDFG